MKKYLDLIPKQYLAWIIVVIVVYAIIMTFLSSFKGGRNKEISIESRNNHGLELDLSKDKSWNECIYNSLEQVYPDAIVSCDNKYSIKVRGVK